MDRELLKHCLVYHGESLLNKLKCEQTENPGFQAVISDLCKASYERYVTKKSPQNLQAFQSLLILLCFSQESQSRIALKYFDP